MTDHAACQALAEHLDREPMPETSVVNVRSGEPYDVYIGRAMPRQRLRASKWANPFRIGKYGTREDVIEQYRQAITTNPRLLAQIGELRGKVLGCWCKPAACHGDVLAELVAALDPRS